MNAVDKSRQKQLAHHGDSVFVYGELAQSFVQRASFAGVKTALP
jgi:hypothetical protein